MAETLAIKTIRSNIREGYAKRKYEQVFVQHLNHALGSSEETRTWLDLSLDCGYVSKEAHDRLERAYDEVSAMLYALMERWQTFEVHEKSDF